MNRRHMTLGLLATLATARFTGPVLGVARSVEVPANWCGRQFISSGDSAAFDILRTNVSQHESVDNAKAMVNHLAWYFQQPVTDNGETRVDIVAEELADPPGYHLTWTSISADPAVETSHEAVLVYRDTYSWNVQGKGSIAPDSPSIIPDLVQHLISREADEGTSEPGSGQGGLWNLLPTADELGGDYQLDYYTDPSGQYDADGNLIKP